MPKGDGTIKKMIREQFPDLTEEKVEECETWLYDFAELMLDAGENLVRQERLEREGKLEPGSNPQWSEVDHWRVPKIPKTE